MRRLPIDAPARRLLLRLAHVPGTSSPHQRAVVETLTLDVPTLVVASGAAAAGALMIVSLRDIYVVGPLIALVLVPAAAIAGCAAASGQWQVAGRALVRVGCDGGLVLAAAAIVFWAKQRTVHRRRPLD